MGRELDHFKEQTETGAEWQVSYDDGYQRTTTLAFIAWKADNDPEATVEQL